MSRMMRLTVLVLTLSMSWSALAATSGYLSGGISSQGGALRPYVYGEFGVIDDIALGVEYNTAAVTVSLWSGVARGMYAQASWASFETVRPDAAELGFWANVDVSRDFGLVAWAGARAVKGDPKIGLSLNAQVDFPVSRLISVLGGASLSVLGSTNTAYGWIGLGTWF